MLLVAFLPMLSVAVSAQVTVSGIVRDNGNEPIIGASVMERGTANGTVTDLDGQFSLNVSSENAVLVFSQFTSFLAMVRQQLDKQEQPYCGD